MSSATTRKTRRRSDSRSVKAAMTLTWFTLPPTASRYASSSVEVSTRTS